MARSKHTAKPNPPQRGGAFGQGKAAHSGFGRGKGKGKGALRHQNMSNKLHLLRRACPKSAMAGCAKKGGLVRTSEEYLKLLREDGYKMVQELLKTALMYVDHGRRKTVTVMDIVMAYQRIEGVTLYT